MALHLLNPLQLTRGVVSRSGEGLSPIPVRGPGDSFPRATQATPAYLRKPVRGRGIALGGAEETAQRCTGRVRR
ncbi:hypothetical protein GCM10023321_58960 [Pseudonocardia eucalypti]|uniref:Uncharacterized protein n=1 Tax=Pseudonocardia eucalypti TaxID=648755 RepID=A0ABP9QSW9_9PSEU